MVTEQAQIQKTRKAQVRKIKKELNLKPHFFIEYDKKDDAINVGNNWMVLTLDQGILDKKDYMDTVKIAYGRLMEALDYNLLHMPIQGNA